MVVGRSVERDVLDALWVVMGADVFYLLTQIEGRPVDDYEQWLVTTIRRLLNHEGTWDFESARPHEDP
jgi:hypothetical protein